MCVYLTFDSWTIGQYSDALGGSTLQTSVAGWLEAFGAHPRIGDAATLRAKLGGFAEMSRDEQSTAASAPNEVFQAFLAPSPPFTLLPFHTRSGISIS